jgi:geranylgeranyl diphosphate synthase type II
MKTYQDLFTLIEQHISALRYQKEPRELYDPIHYMLSLGGKRLRPVLVLMAADVFDADVNKALPAALAVEVFHNFTLVHDDIMDHADIRRGKPTVHKKWNQTIAILSGDLMMIKAIELLCETETGKLKELIDVFTKAGAEVCEGQQWDMNFESRNDVQVSAYLDMITLKTAVLLGASLQLGAIIAGVSEKQAKAMYEFGKNIGVAFQIQDDILDAFGDGDKVGKKIGGDITTNKKTLLYIKALELADPITKAELEQLYQSKSEHEEEKIAAVLTIFKEVKVLEEAEKLKATYLAEAFSHLDRIEAGEDKKEILRNTAIDLMKRMS